MSAELGASISAGAKIDVAGLCVQYGDTVVLHDLSLQVAEGEMISVIGGSGCGKTTLLHVIAGLVPPNKGTVRIDGRVVTGPAADRVMVFQEDAVFPWMTVRRNVEYGLLNKPIGRQEREAIVRKTLALVELDGRAELYPRQLSGGMRKRVDVARALAVAPEILLMDEPYASLDAMTKERLQLQFVQIHQGRRMTVIFVTHDLEEALFVASRIIVMSGSPGRVSSLLEVPIARPRTLDMKRSAQFQALRGELAARLETAGVRLEL